MINVTAYCDGGAKPNPGKAYGSFIVFEDNSYFSNKDIPFEVGTNNQAEYKALIALLEYLRDNGYDSAIIRMDSELVISQVTNIKNTANAGLKPLKEKVTNLLTNFKDITFQHISGDRMKLVIGH